MMPEAQDVNRRQVFLTELHKTIFLLLTLRFDSALAYYKFVHLFNFFSSFYAAAAASNNVSCLSTCEGRLAFN